MKHSFFPTEIIFSTTTACNLHCAHCFVSRTPKNLDIQTAITFLNTCILNAKNNPALPLIQKIGFTGGEPFLYMDFICELSRAAVKLDLLFDQIMTNGDWWKDEKDLQEKLQQVYDAGFDGKIGLSWDSFHGQKPERMQTFIQTVQKIFGENSINVQTVLQEGEVSPSLQPAKLSSATPSAGSNAARNACFQNLPVTQFLLPQTFPSTSPFAWKSKHWFKEDYCQGPGNILYVHSNGNIAPCCGFANENKELFIGTIKDSLDSIMENAAKNKMIQLCFSKGLHTKIRKAKKILPKEFKKSPCTGHTSDICSFCDFICKTTLF